MRRGGTEEPPQEAYSRVTNPERYEPLRDFALNLAARLFESYEVKKEEGEALDSELAVRPLIRPTVRLSPMSTDMAPLAFAFTDFPGLAVRAGRWHIEAFPRCGCDACDEDVERLKEDIDSLVSDVVEGRTREELLPVAEGAHLIWESWSPSGSRRSDAPVERERAHQMLLSSQRRSFEWQPWARRST